MAKRVCANCGKDKEVKSGRVCDKGHFICSDCVHGSSAFQVLLGPSLTSCPLCGKKLR